MTLEKLLLIVYLGEKELNNNSFLARHTKDDKKMKKYYERNAELIRKIKIAKTFIDTRVNQ